LRQAATKSRAAAPGRQLNLFPSDSEAAVLLNEILAIDISLSAPG